MNFSQYFTLLQEGNNRPCVVVDVQPAYDSAICRKIIRFISNHKGPVLLYINGDNTGLTEDTIDSVKEYWEDYGFDPDEWDNRVEIIDKGFGYLRAWMDLGVDAASIIKAIRIMYQEKITDSRDFGEVEKWKEVLDDDAIPEYDPISVNWLNIKKLREYNKCYLMGGGRNECLEEVALMMNAFNIKYRKIDSLIY